MSSENLADLHRQLRAYQAIANHAPQIITRIDRDLRYAYVNPAISHTGIEPEALIGKLPSDVGMRPEDVAALRALVAEVFATGEDRVVERSLQSRRGERHYRIRYVAEWGDDGDVMAVLSYADDITLQVQAEMSLRFLAEASARFNASLDSESTLAEVAQLAVPHIADWCVVDIADDDGAGTLRRLAIAHSDPVKMELAWETNRRYPPQLDAPGGPMAVFRTGQSEFVPDIPDEVLVAAAKDPEHLDALRRLGLRSYLAVPLIARERTLGVMTFINGDDGRRFTPADISLAVDLASRAALAIDNARLFTAEREARRTAEEAAQLRQEFLSIASHELRTPLTSVKASAQLLERRLQRENVAPERVEGLMGQLQREIGRLELLVTDLLNATQIQQGRLDLHLAPVDLAELARQSVERFQQGVDTSDQSQHQIRLDAPVAVVGNWDAARLDQVLTNLISNALKYSPEGGEVRVTVRQFGAAAEVEVRDQGIGMTSDEQRQLFQPFVRGLTARQTTSGTGLGLYITAQIVDRHGGSISVESEPGRGSAFTVRLPLEQPLPPA